MKHRACHVDEIPPDRGHEVVVAGRVVGLFRQPSDDGSETIAALDGLCPHAGGPLATGYCRDGVVMCPWHGWSFRLTDGTHATAPQITVERYAVEVENGEVFLSFDDAPNE